MAKNVVVVGGGPSAKHLSEILQKQKNIEVTQILANTFIEWTPAMAQVLAAKPHMYEKAVCANPESFQVRGITYKYGPVTSIDTAGKKVSFKPADGSEESVSYDALAVCTGSNLSALNAKVGATFAERRTEVQETAAAILTAKSVVVLGGGIVGVEFVGCVKTAYPDKTVTLVTRDKVLKTFPEKISAKATAALEKLGVKVVSGTPADAPTDAVLTQGSFTVNGEAITYDVFFPMFWKGPNTQFVPSSLLDSSGFIMVNEFLQSQSQSEIFAVGVGNNKEAFTGLGKLEGQWKDAAKNIKAYLSNGKMTAHKEAMPWMKNPPYLPVGVGKDAWAVFDFSSLPPPLKCCCCCGLGGFPCCPPPCCWCCCKPCCCGYCCGAPEGNGPAAAMEPMAIKSMTFHFKGVGDAPKQQAMA